MHQHDKNDPVDETNLIVIAEGPEKIVGKCSECDTLLLVFGAKVTRATLLEEFECHRRKKHNRTA